MEHHEFMRRCVELSREKMHEHQGGPFGAIVVKDGEIVGEGWNCVTSHNDPTAHAEMVAIRDACSQLSTFRLDGALLYTSCEPCPMCLSAIYWAHISRVYYANTTDQAAAIGFDDRFLYEQLTLPSAERSVICAHVVLDEASDVFAEWARMSDRIGY